MSRSISFRNADDLYRQVSVRDVSQVLKRTERDAEAKRLELKELVSSRYHDLIDSADAIVGMADSVGEFRQLVSDIKTGSLDLIEKRLDFVKLSSTKVNFKHQENVPEKIAPAECLTEQELAERAHALLVIPSMVWTAIELKSLWIATYLLLVAVELEKSVCPPVEIRNQETKTNSLEVESVLELDENMMEALNQIKNNAAACKSALSNGDANGHIENSLWKRFPLLRSQCNVVRSCRAQVVQCAKRMLQSNSLSVEQISGAFVALIVLDDTITSQDECIQLLLQTRGSALDSYLSNSKLTEPNQPGEVLEAVLKYCVETLQRTVIETCVVFGSSVSSTSALLPSLLQFSPTCVKSKLAAMEGNNAFSISNRRFIDTVSELVNSLQCDRFSSTLTYFDASDKIDETFESETPTVMTSLKSWLTHQRDVVAKKCKESLESLHSIRDMSQLQSKLQQFEDSIQSRVLQEWNDSLDTFSTHDNITTEKSNDIQQYHANRYHHIFEGVVGKPQVIQRGDKTTSVWIFPFLFKLEVIERTSKLIQMSFVSFMTKVEGIISAEANTNLLQSLSARYKVAQAAEKTMLQQQAIKFGKSRLFNEQQRESISRRLIRSMMPLRNPVHRSQVSIEFVMELEKSIATIILDACGVPVADTQDETDSIVVQELVQQALQTLEDAPHDVSNITRSQCAKALSKFVSYLDDSVTSISESLSQMENIGWQDINLEQAYRMKLEEEHLLLIGRVCDAIPASSLLQKAFTASACCDDENVTWDSEFTTKIKAPLANISTNVYVTWAKRAVAECAIDLQDAMVAEDFTVSGVAWKALHCNWVDFTEDDITESADDNDDASVQVPASPSDYIIQYLLELANSLQIVCDNGSSVRLSDTTMRLEFENDLQTISNCKQCFETKSQAITSLIAEQAWKILESLFSPIFKTESDESLSEEVALQCVLDLKYCLSVLSPSLKFGSEQEQSTIQNANQFINSVIEDHVDGVIWYLYEKGIRNSLVHTSNRSTLLAGPFATCHDELDTVQSRTSTNLENNGESIAPNYLTVLQPSAHIPLLPVATKFKLPAKRALQQQQIRRSSTASASKSKGNSDSRSNSLVGNSTDDNIREKAMNVMGSVGTNILSQIFN